jgi:hypothetical protein
MVILFEPMNSSFDDFVAPDKPQIRQPIIDPGSCIFAVFLDPCLDVVIIGIQQALSITGAGDSNTSAGFAMYLSTVLRLTPSFLAMARFFSPFRYSVIMSNMVSFFSNQSPVQS